MSKKYIAQVNSNNFVYPNNTLAEYDVDIVHDINNYSVSGTVSNLVTSLSLGNTRLNYSFDYTWSRNNAEPYIQNTGRISLLSVHLMAAVNTYYKPYQLIVSTYDNDPTINNYSEFVSGFITVQGGGVFPVGDYYFEFRFIGHRAIFPVCMTKTLVGVTPTPTPTVTPTSTPGLTTTPTPTPTPTSTPTSGVDYDYYTADVFACTNCAESIDTILVAFVAGTPVTPGRFYIPVGGPDGNSYRIDSSTGPGIALILTNIYGSFTTCAFACIV
jgi:hypothetical protein